MRQVKDAYGGIAKTFRVNRFPNSAFRGASRLVAIAAALALTACAPAPPRAARTPQPIPGAVFVVRQLTLPAMISAFAVVESPDASAARARIGGSVRQLLVDEGDMVRQGQVIAIVVDETLGPRAAAPRAQSAALRAQLRQAEADIARFEALNAQGFYPTRSLEAAKANAQALREQIRAMDAETSSVTTVQGQGRVLAPVSGRVLQTPVTAGSVVAPGEIIATIGANYVLRVKLPERAAAALRPGVAVLVESGNARVEAVVSKVYPALADGRVQADVSAPGVANLLYGQRVRVWVSGANSNALIVPASYLRTRYGVDFARVLNRSGVAEDVVVRRGEPRPGPNLPDGVEILAGLKPGDRLVR